MTHPSLVLLVSFETSLSLDEILEIAEARADEFRALGGLLQKYYLHDPASGRVGGLYLWESAAAFDDYRNSELRATIAEAYQSKSEPQIQVFQVAKTLREDRL